MTPYESVWVLNIRAGNELGSMLQRVMRALLGPARPMVCCQDLSSMLTPSHDGRLQAAHGKVHRRSVVQLSSFPVDYSPYRP